MMQQSSQKDVQSHTDESLVSALEKIQALPKNFKEFMSQTQAQQDVLTLLNNFSTDTDIERKGQFMTSFYQNKTYPSAVSSLQKLVLQAVDNHFKTQTQDSQEKINYLSPLREAYLKIHKDIEDIRAFDPLQDILHNYHKNDNKKTSHQDRIAELLLYHKIIQDKSEITSIKTNIPEKSDSTYTRPGINPSFIFVFQGKNHFIKTCSSDTSLGATNGRIHPNELLIYKIMEYTGFGPKTRFLLRNSFTSGGSQNIHAGNYIMTDDLSDEQNTFMTDAGVIDSKADWVEKALKTKHFAIDVSAASLLYDILSLRDAFGANMGNYGILADLQKNTYSIKFVDHLPDAYNGLFSIYRDGFIQYDQNKYSPRNRLQSYTRGSLKESIFYDLTESRNTFIREAIAQDVDNRLSELGQAITDAYQDIQNLIVSYNCVFIKDAMNALAEYVEKIGKNHEFYEKNIRSNGESQGGQQQSLGEIGK